MKPSSYIPAVLILKERNKLMQSSNKHRSLVLSSTFVGLVCGLVLTHQQAYAAQTPSVSNQQSQITAVAAPNNNLPKTVAVNQDYSVENKNIANPAARGPVTPSTYSSLQTNAITKQDSSLQTNNSDVIAVVPTPNTGATVPAGNGTATSTNPENNNSTNPATSSPSPDTGNSANTPTASDDNQTNDNSNTTAASSEQPETNIIAQGTWGTSKWDYTQEGADYILHLHAGTLGTPEGNEGIGSLDAAFEQQLTQIVIDSGVIANQNSSGLFRNLKNVQTIQGLENLDTSQVTNMSRMFEYCESLTKLNLSSWNTSNVENVSWMFNECTNLFDLNLDNWNTLKINYDGLYAMLNHCKSLSKLVLGPKAILTSALLPDVPEIGTKVPDTDTTVTASYWVATSGYQQGQRYTSAELEQLTGRDQVTTYDWFSQPLFASTVNSKVVTRTINVHNPDGTTHSEKQTVMLSQEIKNNADGTQTVGPWSTAQWAAYAIPEIAGYTANPSTVAAQTVNEKTQEQTVDVYYEPVLQQITVNYLDNGKIVGTQILSGYAGETIIPQYRAPKGYEIIDQPQGQVSFTTAQQQIIQVAVQAQILKTSETKSLIRTVNIHRPSGTIQTYRQPVVLMRTVYVNAVNGAKSYGSWSVGSWDAVPVPVITGYTASQAQVAAQQVTAQDSDQLLDIYYTKA